ncbi:hypothetical protein OJ996_23010 [Luteolibacter sp. GHJ8]|uniref:Uncharacterized protein n=1 Tax=Luteolibacter rhizosphaerae TaxID=2989719 RepID=A0ABT3G9F0_9BACT|nr:hypothetical protein [Luteolibacter rhizosphaerae]MCW1916476.1 hypothetical protein [Luteolibacter rhizosphaerae]
MFFVASEFGDADISRIEGFVDNLKVSRAWMIHAPVFVNEEDEETSTLGLYLDLYSALPPADLPLEVDRQALEEVKELVSHIQALSRTTGLAFDVTLDEDDIGSIENGELDRNFRVGFLEEWERVLVEREGG